MKLRRALFDQDVDDAAVDDVARRLGDEHDSAVPAADRTQLLLDDRRGKSGRSVPASPHRMGSGAACRQATAISDDRDRPAPGRVRARFPAARSCRVRSAARTGRCRPARR